MGSTPGPFERFVATLDLAPDDPASAFCRGMQIMLEVAEDIQRLRAAGSACMAIYLTREEIEAWTSFCYQEQFERPWDGESLITEWDGVPVEMLEAEEDV